ncbi:response regulator [Trinickia sp. LjRoot230]
MTSDFRQLTNMNHDETTDLSRELRILLLEDEPEQAELICLALTKARIEFVATRAETKNDFISKLRTFRPDIVLSDYNLPDLNGRAALDIARQYDRTVPVVMVTGALGDDEAVELIKAGARDYVLKDRLARLGPAVRRALAEEEELRHREAAEQALRRSELSYRRLSGHIQDVREEEKARFARELHDDLGQQLTALKMAVALVEHNLQRPVPPPSGSGLSGLNALIDQSIESVRRIAADLRPPMLDDLGPIPAVEWLISEFSARCNVQVISRIDDTLTFNQGSGIEVFRIVQEALTNVARHASATEVKLDIVRDEPNCIVRIADNGHGTARDTRPGRRHSLGLLGLRERAARLGGEIEIRTAPGSGFTLTAILRLTAVEAGGAE